MSIYVETTIRGPLDRLWELTQDPKLHQQWDLRFTEIDYLPRQHPDEPQRFLYLTRIGFGLAIRGEGESFATRDGADGERTSALKFWSADKKSLIREGSGYWKYQPRSDGVRFFTVYDYDVRYGRLGRLFDAIVFRPLIAWATAWSFDRLRIWIERGIDPAASRDRAIVHWMARIGLAFVWLYQGIVPKLIRSHADELSLVQEAGIPSEWAVAAVYALGLAEVLFGLLLLARPRWRWPLIATIPAMLLATIDVAITSPRFLGAAFNPVTLNVATAILAAIAWATFRDLPSARHCITNSPERTA